MYGAPESGLAIGLIVTIALARAVKPLFAFTTDRDKPSPPTGMDPAAWQLITQRGSSGFWIGFLEAFFCFCMFWLGAYEAIAGWFAFKVAAKWEAWANIVKFPDKLGNLDEFDFLRARSDLGTWIMSKFLIGSLLNLLAGLLGSVAGKYVVALSLCR